MINFDFKNNWSEIVKRLDYHSVQCIIKSSIKKYLRDTDHPRKYNKELFPCQYGEGDNYEIINDEIEDELKERLIKDGIISKDWDAPDYENILKKCKGDDIKANEIYDKKYEKYEESGKWYRYESYCQDKMKPYIYDIMKQNYKSYKLRGGCHWWNNTFGLKMATYIFPKEKWEVVSNHLHTTIVNKNRTKVFDILLYDEDADDFGGSHAYNYATFEGTQEEFDELYPIIENPKKIYNKKDNKYFSQLKINNDSDIDIDIEV